MTPPRPVTKLDAFPESLPENIPPICIGFLRLMSFLLRIAFHLLYYPLAFSYDAVAWLVSLGEWSEWRRSAIPYLPQGPVLEIAHGTGTLALDMAKRGFRVFAFDLSPAMNRIAATKILRAGRRQAPRSRLPVLFRADVRRLPLPPESFASAVSTFPSEYIFHTETIREVYRALTPGGVWIIVPSACPRFLERVLGGRHLEEKYFCSGLSKEGWEVKIERGSRAWSTVLILCAKKPPAKRPD